MRVTLLIFHILDRNHVLFQQESIGWSCFFLRVHVFLIYVSTILQAYFSVTGAARVAIQIWRRSETWCLVLFPSWLDC